MKNSYWLLSAPSLCTFSRAQHETLHLVNNETTHLSIEIHQTTKSIQHLKSDTISESLLHYLLNYMEQGIPLYTPFSKRSAAATALNKVLQHVASTHEPGNSSNITPFTNILISMESPVIFACTYAISYIASPLLPQNSVIRSMVEICHFHHFDCYHPETSIMHQ